MNSADKALAFMLAREGYDVWMGNNRGNWFSLNHTQYDTSQEEFWQFDFEEMGIYDLPAQIDHILNTTHKDKLAAYIGHSEGTT
jgi:pimeloyl-ACP methyl ester carboxylesterase